MNYWKSSREVPEEEHNNRESLNILRHNKHFPSDFFLPLSFFFFFFLFLFSLISLHSLIFHPPFALNDLVVFHVWSICIFMR